MKKSDHITLRETLSIHFRAVRDVHRVADGIFLSVMLSSAAEAVSPYITIWFSAQLINELAYARRVDVLIRWAVLTVIITVMIGLIRAGLKRWNAVQESIYDKRYTKLYVEKFLSMDYAAVDDQKNRDLFAQIQQNENWSGWGLDYLPKYVSWITQSVTGIFSAVVLSVGLFTQEVPETAGTLTILNHPLFLVGIIAMILAVTLIRSALIGKGNSGWANLAEKSRFSNRLFGYFQFEFYADMEMALDVRMYQQNKLASHYVSSDGLGRNSYFNEFIWKTLGIYYALAQSVSSILTGVIYVFVCLKAWAGAFGIGSVTQYVGAVTAMTGNVSRLFSVLAHMQSNAGFLKTTYEFLDIPNHMYQGSLTTEKRMDRKYEIEFKDVSFKYPGSNLWALRHVNMKFKVGERLAIVGENGSGKTTFIKLLCRLYDPQEGEILLNGIDIRKYKYDDYRNLFSVVFQDFQLICQTLGANVAGSTEYHCERVQKALADAGFEERLTVMEKGMNTVLYKDLSEEGVTISGGEAQKIAIARALYKDAPFMILDEPTAALDPIAEAEIYSKFDEITGNRTAIYISHRLSSCKFCDEIAVFHEGAVIQQGTHAELAAEENGKYYELWNAQAQYYAE